MKNEKLLAAVLAATMLSAPLTGCSNNGKGQEESTPLTDSSNGKSLAAILSLSIMPSSLLNELNLNIKSQEEIDNENEIRRLLQQDSIINIQDQDEKLTDIIVSWDKVYGNYYICFETFTNKCPTMLGLFTGGGKQYPPEQTTYTVYQVDSDAYFNFASKYGHKVDHTRQNYYDRKNYKETKSDVELIKNIANNYDPIFSDYGENLPQIGKYNSGQSKFQSIITCLENDANKVLSKDYYLINITDMIESHGLLVDCEKIADKYFVTFRVQEDIDRKKYSENLVDFAKITYQVDQSAYDYFKTVDLKDLANIDPVPFEVLTEQYDPVSIEVFEHPAETQMSK